MYESIRQTILASGLWNDGRHQTHQFRLSPNVHRVSDATRKQLDDLGPALRDCLAGISQILAIARDPRLKLGPAWNFIRQALETHVPAFYRELSCLRPAAVPAIIKVDLLEDAAGHYWIAEIDAHNTHGLGYATLLAAMRAVVAPYAQTYGGVVQALTKELDRRGKKSVFFLYADEERFYAPEFYILRDALAARGYEMTVAAESEIAVMPDGSLRRGDHCWRPELLVALPSMHHNNPLRDWLVSGYLKGAVDFLTPPKPFLGSKAMLAILHNDPSGQDAQEVESILRAHIPIDSLQAVRRHLPETHLIRKKAGVLRASQDQYWQERISGGKWVIKKTISGGMHGTEFHGTPGFDRMLREATQAPNTYILQRVVCNREERYAYYDDHGQLQMPSGGWFKRIIAHYADRRVADLMVTACQDIRVHGGKECLLFGTAMLGDCMGEGPAFLG